MMAEHCKDLRGNLLSKKSIGHIHHPARLQGTDANYALQHRIARQTISQVYLVVATRTIRESFPSYSASIRSRLARALLREDALRVVKEEGSVISEETCCAAHRRCL